MAALWQSSHQASLLGSTRLTGDIATSHPIWTTNLTQGFLPSITEIPSTFTFFFSLPQLKAPSIIEMACTVSISLLLQSPRLQNRKAQICGLILLL